MKKFFFNNIRKMGAIMIALVLTLSSVPFTRAAAAGEPICTPDNPTVIYSAAGDSILPESSAVAVEPNQAWATIPGATWIWEQGDSQGLRIFTKAIPAFPEGSAFTNATLEVLADNSFIVAINGVPIQTGTSGTDTDNFSTVRSYSVPAEAFTGSGDQIQFDVTNIPQQEAPNPGGLAYKLTVNTQSCVTPPSDVTVTIVKYMDGAKANSNNTNNGSYSMTGTWRAQNLNGNVSTSGNFELDSDGFNGQGTPYQAVTSPMTSGADYNAVENNVPATCTAETPYALSGYKVGDTEEAALASPVVQSAAMTNIVTNKYILVMNQNCALVPPTTPVHLSYPDNSVRTTASSTMLDWTDSTTIHPSVTYTYQVAYDWATTSNGAFVSPLATLPGYSVSEIQTPNTPEGIYYWHVQAVDGVGNTSPWTTPWKITIDNTAPTLPVHLSYPNGSSRTTANNMMLDWSDSTDTSSTTYYFESTTNPATSTDGSFVSTAYVSPALTVSEIPTPNTPEGTYYWHVKAVDAAGNSAGWTDAWKIIVDNTGPSTPVHVSPANDVTLTTATWTLADWENATDTSALPVTYIYQSSNSSATTTSGSFASPQYSSPSPLTDSEQPTTGTPEGEWYWHVQATDAAGNTSAWSDAWKVIVSNFPDEGCEGECEPDPETPATTTEPVAPAAFSEPSTGGQRTGAGSVNPVFTLGSVLGASTDIPGGASCKSDLLLKTYMRMGMKNDPAEVRKLQTFLNGQNLGITLPVTGFFGPMTDRAVRAFQLKFKEQVLAPWVKAGLYPDTNVATGYVYKTTLRWINLQICSDLNIPIPELN